jgi:hypothetical protein
MVIILTYIIQHLISPLLLRRRFIGMFVLLSAASLALIYMRKQDSFDIISYTQAMDYPGIFELGYAWLAVAFKAIFAENRAALYAIQVLLCIVFCAPVLVLLRNQRKELVYFILVFLSLAFTLGVNNAIRQAFASLFIVLALVCIFQDQIATGLVLLVLSMFFHTSSVAFFAYSITSYVAARMFFFPSEGMMRKQLSQPLFVIMFLLLGMATFMVLNILLSLGFYQGYGDLNLSVGGRVGSTLKLALVGVVFVISEFFFGAYERKEGYFINFRLLRASFMILLVALGTSSKYSELSARVMYFYFVIELMVILAGFREGKQKGVVVIMLSYAFALNALNILSGGPG